MFIGLWNFCDDSGFFNMSPTAVSLVMPRFRPRSVQTILESLEKAGLVRLCRSSSVGLVVGWSHQKIDKPRSSNWKGKEIQWDIVPDSTNRRRKVATNRRKDRIGEDRIGEDVPSGERLPLAPRTEEQNVGQLVALYCNLWKEKYNSPRSPDIRGKAAGQIKGLVKDLGYARVEILIEAYLQMSDTWFITKTHDVATFLDNLAKVSLFADSGKMITRSQLKQFEKKVESQELDKLIEEGRI